MKNIFKTIQEHKMIRPGMHVLAGVSGGADSVCLMYVLQEYQKQCPFHLTVVHVEHGIRGEESIKDAEFVRELCQKKNIACIVRSCDAPAYAQKKKLGLEEAARILRYEILEQVKEEQRADVIAVAHNENDQAETVFWNLMRGSALRGLGGIRSCTDQVIRPLLGSSRRQIEEILHEAGIAFRNDRTNEDISYTRNRIRKEVFPYLTKYLNAEMTEHIAKTAIQLQKVQNYLDRQSRKAAQVCITEEKNRVSLSLKEWRVEDPCIQEELLKRCLAMVRKGKGLKDIGQIHIEMMEKLCGQPCGRRCSLPGRIAAVREKDALVFYAEGEKKQEPLPNLEGEYRMIPGKSIQIGPVSIQITKETVRGDLSEYLLENQYTKWLSYDTITDEICLRKRKQGDYLVIHENGGRKKLKDFMIDRKIPRDSRDAVWVIAEGSHVLWLVGYRISADVRIKENTENVLKISIQLPEEERR